MTFSFEETVEILMEAAAAGGKSSCHGMAESVTFGQMAPMHTGAFEVTLDIDVLKDGSWIPQRGSSVCSLFTFGVQWMP